MGGSSGKQSTSTQQVQIPPEVLANYQAANSAATTAASQPFQTYSTDPSAFVAPMSATQNAGVAATNAAAGQAQPYFDAAQGQLQDAQSLGSGMTGSAQTALLNAKNNSAPYNGVAGNYYDAAYQGAQPYNQAATGLAAASAQAVNPTTLDSSAINQYMSPYLSSVLGGTAAQLNQDNQKAMSGQTGSAISQGAFGGDRAGIAAATLAGQQQLANAQIYSGILNTGYNNALGAAQQQQGVNLSADQANRAALAGAGQQIQSIGQQGYTQGTTTGQAQQGLGQQVFGQGLSTSQQEGALGQQAYTMGANTAQEQAGLGAAAQTAALQGAQAQLAAGQVQQQTQQAGDTALYNQFLQQQSYPFQTAQFLANVAEGTGSLSGSTTTTTQPGGFFSDKRLKEDIKKIGKTYDGQVIYSFKYKGDPRTQVGLMAQDVEKSHPDAVGESHGFKTVDYGKATEDASERGHFAGGGAPMLPGLSSADMSALLAAQAQMYAPFSQAGGLYGGQSGGMPRGGSSYVPQGNLPVSHLAVAGGLAPQKSGMDSVKEIADTASKAAPYAQKGEDWLKDKWSARNDNSMAANENDMATGGLVPTKKYASGGMPYDAQTGLDIPDDKPDNKLQTAGDLPGQKSGMSDILDMAKIAAMVAGMNRGGRAGFADGGAPEDDTVDFATPSTGGGSPAWPTGTIEKNYDGSRRWNPWGPNPPPSIDLVDAAKGLARNVVGDHSAAGSAIGSAVAKKILEVTHGSGGNDAPAPHVGAPVASIRAAAPATRRSAPPSGGLAPAVAATDAELPTITASSPVSPGGLAPPPADAALSSGVPSEIYQPQKEPGILSRVASGLGDNVKDYASGLKHGDAQNWLPLLAGIAAAGTAPTVHPGVALAAGLGAGAQSYMGTKQKLVDVAQTQAETGNIGVHTAIAEAPAPQDGYTWVQGKGPNGEGITGKDGKSVWHREMNVNATNYGPTASTPQAAALATAAAHPNTPISPSDDTISQIQKQYGVNPSQPPVANRERAIALNPELATLDAAANQKVQERIGNLQDAENARRQVVQSASAYASLPKEGIMSQGHASDKRAMWANIYNTGRQMMGLPPDPELANATSANQIIDKVNAITGPAVANQYGEKAASIAHNISSVLASGDTSPKAAADIQAMFLIQAKQPQDLAQYKDNYPTSSKSGLMVGVEPSFQRDTGPIYAADQHALAAAMQNPHFNDLLDALHSGDPKRRAEAAHFIDSKSKAHISRYLMGSE